MSLLRLVERHSRVLGGSSLGHGRLGGHPLQSGDGRRWFHEVIEHPWIAHDRLVHNTGSRKKKNSIQRGFGGGSRAHGRGMNGFYKQAGNKLRATFETDTPLWKRLPKFWRKRSTTKRQFRPLNLHYLQWCIDVGKLNPKEPITMQSLYRAKLLKQSFTRFPLGVKLTAKGKVNFRSTIDIEVPMASYAAAQKVLECGGNLKLVYMTALGVRAHIRPERWTRKNMPVPKFAGPKPRWAYFYTERDEEGPPYRPISSPEDVLYVHPRRALYKGLFEKSIHDRLVGKMREGELEFAERLERAQKQWQEARDAIEAEVASVSPLAPPEEPKSLSETRDEEEKAEKEAMRQDREIAELADDLDMVKLENEASENTKKKPS